MPSAPEASDPVGELRSFLVFLGSLWGVLAGVSVLFPLSNVLTDVIPLASIENDGAFIRISPAVVSVVSTISVLFTVFFLFGNRAEFADESRRLRNRRHAVVMFGTGIVLLLGYLGVYELKLEDASDEWGWQSDNSAHLLLEIPLMLLYAGFFVSLTSAFVLLALNEYEATPPEGASQAQPNSQGAPANGDG